MDQGLHCIGIPSHKIKSTPTFYNRYLHDFVYLVASLKKKITMGIFWSIIGTWYLQPTYIMHDRPPPPLPNLFSTYVFAREFKKVR